MTAFIAVAAIIRLLILMVVLWSSFKHRDWMGMSIGVLWSFAIYVSTFTTLKVLASTVATPLVFLMAWGIIKRHSMADKEK